MGLANIFLIPWLFTWLLLFLGGACDGRLPTSQQTNQCFGTNDHFSKWKRMIKRTHHTRVRHWLRFWNQKRVFNCPQAENWKSIFKRNFIHLWDSYVYIYIHTHVFLPFFTLGSLGSQGSPGSPGERWGAPGSPGNAIVCIFHIFFPGVSWGLRPPGEPRHFKQFFTLNFSFGDRPPPSL